MWTHTANANLNDDWQPNHFVYLLKKEREIAQVVILLLYRQNKN
jgi:hypothetical protein